MRNACHAWARRQRIELNGNFLTRRIVTSAAGVASCRAGGNILPGCLRALNHKRPGFTAYSGTRAAPAQGHRSMRIQGPNAPRGREVHGAGATRRGVRRRFRVARRRRRRRPRRAAALAHGRRHRRADRAAGRSTTRPNAGARGQARPARARCARRAQASGCSAGTLDRRRRWRGCKSAAADLKDALRRAGPRRRAGRDRAAGRGRDRQDRAPVGRRNSPRDLPRCGSDLRPPKPRDFRPLNLTNLGLFRALNPSRDSALVRALAGAL